MINVQEIKFQSCHFLLSMSLKKINLIVLLKRLVFSYHSSGWE